MSTEKPENTKPLQITSASDFRKKSRKELVEGELVELPSGNVVRLARPSLANMIKDGRIPSSLIPAAMGTVQGATPQNAQELKKSIEVIDSVLIHSFVEPKLVKENPSDDEIELADLSDNDRAAAFSYVQGGVALLKKFRRSIGLTSS